ncbi:Lipopolysaccharide-assembly protein, LptC-related [Limihaloglobus sulfuriphilus]|uniref:Lipopolysaccharide-assembly protein, LptC-related n=1 Tax=Limihaloglobus sulfuriphilus TaxID=1851148 RepID=A0A1Q2MHV4_9BACT|nr:hypothetical protein [Limihaloglobus sulfuriphilus]AQQ71877.1 Lipopolysaccharide-assembly protein, LptC-related [Limihaloglobus sulfuriphilus]
MAGTRKIAVFSITLVIAAAVFIVYLLFFGGAEGIKIDQPQTDQLKENNIDELFETEGVDREGEVKIGQTDISEYKMFDESGNLTRRFGFSGITQKKDGEWLVEKPFIEVYEKDFVLMLGSMKGRVIVDIVGGHVFPSDASLYDGVEIVFEPRGEDKSRRCVIEMDDIRYYSDSSEFRTDGKVSVTSAQASIKGRGMTLIYNDLKKRIRLLRIDKLSEAVLQYARQDISSGADNSEKEDSAAKSGKDAAAELYQCSIYNDVTIKDGTNSISARQILVTNLHFFETGDSSAEDSDEQSSEQQTPPQDTTKIVITANGGLELKPIETQQPAPAELTRQIKFEGEPVVVYQQESPIVQSGAITYDIDRETLLIDPSTVNEQVKFSFSDENTKSLLSSRGQIFWDRAGSLARIEGPGTVRAVRTAAQDDYELKFKDSISVYFDPDYKPRESDRPVLKRIEIHNGFELAFGDDLNDSVKADKASVYFDDGLISSIDISDNVRLSYLSGKLETKQARVDFKRDFTGTTVPVNVQATGLTTMSFVDKDASTPVVMTAPEVNYDPAEQIAIAKGPVKLLYYPGAEFAQSGFTQPAQITARDRLEFHRLDNTAVLVGEVHASGTRETDQYNESYSFKGDKLSIQFSRRPAAMTESDDSGKPDQSEKTPATGSGREVVKKLELTGNRVYFNTQRKYSTGREVKLRLESASMDYDGIKDVITASGRGQIQLSNLGGDSSSAAPLPGGSLSLGRPCYALIERFNQLRWDIGRGRIDAHTDQELIHMAYVPLDNEGKPMPANHIDAGRVSVSIEQAPETGPVIKNFTADNSVIYKEDGGHQFFGESIFYDENDRLLKVAGSENNPCIFDNNFVDGIVYNIDTGDYKFRVVESGGFSGTGITPGRQGN